MTMPTTSATDSVLCRLQDLVQEGKEIPIDDRDTARVASAPMIAWRTRSVAFLKRTLGPSDTYTEAFVSASDGTRSSSRDNSVAILASLREDVEGGYLTGNCHTEPSERVADSAELRCTG